VTGEGELSIELGDPWPWPWPGGPEYSTQCARRRATFRIQVHAAPRPCQPRSAGILGSSVASSERARSADLELDVEPGLMWANDSTGLPSGKLTAPAGRGPWDYCFPGDLRADPHRAPGPGEFGAYRQFRLRGLDHL